MMNLDESHHSDVEVDVEDIDLPADNNEESMSLVLEQERQAVSTMTKEKAMLDGVDSASRQVIERMLKEEKIYADGKLTVRTPAPKLARNPLQTNGRWTNEETSLYESGVEIFGEGAWAEIADLVQTKSVNQVRNYAKRLKLREREAAKNITIVEPETPAVHQPDVHRTAQTTIPVRDRARTVRNRTSHRVAEERSSRKNAGSPRSSDEEEVIVVDDERSPDRNDTTKVEEVVERNGTDDNESSTAESESDSTIEQKSESLLGNTRTGHTSMLKHLLKAVKDTEEIADGSVIGEDNASNTFHEQDLEEANTKVNVVTKIKPKEVSENKSGDSSMEDGDRMYYVSNTSNVILREVPKAPVSSSNNTSKVFLESEEVVVVDARTEPNDARYGKPRVAGASGICPNSRQNSSGSSIVSATGTRNPLKFGTSALPVVLKGSEPVDRCANNFNGGVMFQVPSVSGYVKNSTDVSNGILLVDKLDKAKLKWRPIRMKPPNSVVPGHIQHSADRAKNTDDPLRTVKREMTDVLSSSDDVVDVKRRKTGNTENGGSGIGKAGSEKKFSPVIIKVVSGARSSTRIVRAPIFVPPTVEDTDLHNTDYYSEESVSLVKQEIYSTNDDSSNYHSSPRERCLQRRSDESQSEIANQEDETASLFMEVESMEEENVSPTKSNASISHGTDVVRKVRAPIALIPSGVPINAIPCLDRNMMTRNNFSNQFTSKDNSLYYSVKEEVVDSEDCLTSDVVNAKDTTVNTTGLRPVSTERIKTEPFDDDNDNDKQIVIQSRDLPAWDSRSSELVTPLTSRTESESSDEERFNTYVKPSDRDVKSVSPTSRNVSRPDVVRKVSASIFVPPIVDGRNVPNKRLRASRSCAAISTGPCAVISTGPCAAMSPPRTRAPISPGPCAAMSPRPCASERQAYNDAAHASDQQNTSDDERTEEKNKPVIMVTRACSESESKPTIYVYGSKPKPNFNSNDIANNYCVVELDMMAGHTEPVNDLPCNRFYHERGGYVLAPLDAYRRAREENVERRTAMEESMAAAEETMFSPYIDRMTFLAWKEFLMLQWQRRSPNYLSADESCRDFSNDTKLVKRVHEYLERVGVINKGCVEVDLTKPIGFPPTTVEAAKIRKTPERDAELPRIQIERTDTSAEEAAVDWSEDFDSGADGGQSQNVTVGDVPAADESLDESPSEKSKDAILDPGLDDTDPGDRFYLQDGGYLTLPVPVSERSLDKLAMADDEKKAFSMFREERFSSNRTPSDYLRIRNHMVDFWKKIRPSYLNKVKARGALKYDVKIVGKIHAFLEKIGAINFCCPEVQYNKSIGWLVRDPVRSTRKIFPESVRSSADHAVVVTRKRKVKLSCGHWRSAEERGECQECVAGQDDKGTPVKKRRKASCSKLYDPFALVACRDFGTSAAGTDVSSVRRPAGTDGSSVRRPPFRVEFSCSSLATVGVHSLLCTVEVIGLLGGRYCREARRLSVEVAEPCESLSTEMQCEMDPVSQTLAIDAIQNVGLCVVGWYHSHPTFPPDPSVRDLETQQFMQEYFACSGSPFIGVITQPYNVPDPVTRCLTVRPSQPGQAHGTPYRFDYTLAEVESTSGELLRGKLRRLVESAVTHPRRVSMLTDSKSESSPLRRFESHLANQLSDRYDDSADICESVVALIRRSFPPSAFVDRRRRANRSLPSPTTSDDEKE